MPAREQIRNTTTQASDLIDRELANPSDEASPELIDALAKASAELKRQAGDDASVADLVVQVDRLIAKRRKRYVLTCDK